MLSSNFEHCLTSIFNLGGTYVSTNVIILFFSSYLVQNSFFRKNEKLVILNVCLIIGTVNLSWFPHSELTLTTQTHFEEIKVNLISF
jgi:hypothetical protein